MDLAAYVAQAEADERQRRPLIEQPVLIAVVSGDRTTYPHIGACLANVVMAGGLADGTRIGWNPGGGGALAHNRSQLAEQAILGDFGSVWFIDDDNAFTFDTLTRLLRHNVDVVVPVVLKRMPPHTPTMWAPWPIAPTATDADLVTGFTSSFRRDAPTFPPRGARGLVEIGHGSTGGMLIATRVLRALDAPHFQFGKINTATAGEDSWLCLRARRAGFRLWCDLDTPMGHATSTVVWPKLDAEGAIGHSYEFEWQALSPKFRARLGYPTEAR